MAMTTHLLLSAIPWMARSLAERMTLSVHITAGALAIVLGFVALFATKGASVHRQAGIWFVYAMVVMGLVGATVATVWQRVMFINLPAGLISAYFVVTALTTVKDSLLASRSWATGLMLVALTLGSYNLCFGSRALTSADGVMWGFPAPPFLIFGVLGLLAAAGDIRLLRSGPLTGSRRVARHLWRMTLALFIATGSFFLGQAKVFPKPIRILPLLAIPPLIVIAALLYWMWRVRLRKSLRGLVQLRPPAAPMAPQGLA